ncbi:hypothetical protein [Anabaena sp. 4-3]|uniref:hypothetical protein n=1 Tax=Anabaena sp. 4-3 TaxID=1811979 RepID=UPI0012E8520D|nr:hypothetical protein [Anabaena sp. 4-3]
MFFWHQITSNKRELNTAESCQDNSHKPELCNFHLTEIKPWIGKPTQGLIILLIPLASASLGCFTPDISHTTNVNYSPHIQHTKVYMH